MRQYMTSAIGYPRIGEYQEWNAALDAYMSGNNDEHAFIHAMKNIRLANLARQQKLGIDWITSNDFSFYDHMLDMTAMFGMIPERFNYSGGPVSLALYYAMAKGTDDVEACSLAPWLNTNYYYVVPELGGGRVPQLTENKPLIAYMEAKQALGLETKPVLVGPYSYVKLSTAANTQANVQEWVMKLLPIYGETLRQLQKAGVEWVQLDEPCLTQPLTGLELDTVNHAYAYLQQAAPDLNKMLQISYGPVTCYQEIVALPVQGVGLDFVYGREENKENVKLYGFPSDKRFGIGLIDGQQIWRTDLQEAVHVVRELSTYCGDSQIVLQPSCTLIHVPVTLADESALAPEWKNLFAFADEKLGELTTLQRALNRIGTAALEAEEQIHESTLLLKHRPSGKSTLIEKQMKTGWVQACGSRVVRLKIS